MMRGFDIISFCLGIMYFGLGGKVLSLAGVIMCFGFSLFGYEFLIWVFPKLSILEIDEQNSDLCNFPFVVFILVGYLRFPIDIFEAVVWVFVGISFDLIYGPV